MRIDATARAEAVVTAARAAHPGEPLTFVFGSGWLGGLFVLRQA